MFFSRRVALLLVTGLFLTASSVQAGDGTKITVKDLTIPGIIIGTSVDLNPAYFQNPGIYTSPPTIQNTSKFWYGANGGAFLNVINTAEFRVSAGTHTVYAIDASSDFKFAFATIASATFTVKKGKTLKLKVTGSGNSLAISEL